MSKKVMTKIPNSMAVEALQILSNYCLQETPHCTECIMKLKGTCIFGAELPEKHRQWIIERSEKNE